MPPDWKPLARDICTSAAEAKNREADRVAAEALQRQMFEASVEREGREALRKLPALVAQALAEKKPTFLLANPPMSKHGTAVVQWLKDYFAEIGVETTWCGWDNHEFSVSVASLVAAAGRE